MLSFTYIENLFNEWRRAARYTECTLSKAVAAHTRGARAIKRRTVGDVGSDNKRLNVDSGSVEQVAVSSRQSSPKEGVDTESFQHQFTHVMLRHLMNTGLPVCHWTAGDMSHCMQF